MAGRTFLVVDRASLDSALADADAHDKIVVAEGAFDASPRLAVDGARWRLNGWSALPAEPATSDRICWALPGASYAATWATLARAPPTRWFSAGGPSPLPD